MTTQAYKIDGRSMSLKGESLKCCLLSTVNEQFID